MNEPLIGLKLGQYELHAHLGQGGMATVYRGFQPSLGRSVAVKVLPLTRLPDPALPARFRREAQLAASLMHPNIVPFTVPTSEGLMRQHLEMPVPPLVARRSNLPAGFEDVVQTALAKEPERRYRHAGELKAALEAAGRQSQAASFHARTDLDSTGGALTTSPDLGQTMRIADQLRLRETDAQTPRASVAQRVLVALVLVLVVLLAGAVGYIMAGGRLESRSGLSPTATVDGAAVHTVNTPTLQPVGATPTTPLAPTPPPTVEAQPPTAAPPKPSAPTAAAPTSAPAAKPTLSQPTAPAKSLATATAAPDQRFALIERHLSEYFAALNAGDYARAQAVCCTPGWRSRYPLDEWRKNFAGVTDLRFATPFRYTTVEGSRIVAEVDYSFSSSSGSRRYFTLQWTFVPVAGDWLADDAVASPQRRVGLHTI